MEKDPVAPGATRVAAGSPSILFQILFQNEAAPPARRHDVCLAPLWSGASRLGLMISWLARSAAAFL